MKNRGARLLGSNPTSVAIAGNKWDGHRLFTQAGVPGLTGYVGVDILINEAGCHIIEINPRLTTVYVGLRRVVNINLAEAIWEAAICKDRSTFRKENLM